MQGIMQRCVEFAVSRALLDNGDPRPGDLELTNGEDSDSTDYDMEEMSGAENGEWKR